MGKGRPALFRGAMAKAVAGLLKANGLKGGKELLALMGSASLPTLQKLAKEHGVEFQRGRPATGEKPAVKETKAKVAKDAKPKRGRPLGSKNKAKDAPVAAPVMDTPVVETPVVVAPVVAVEVPVEAPVVDTVPAPAPAVSGEIAA